MKITGQRTSRHWYEIRAQGVDFTCTPFADLTPIAGIRVDPMTVQLPSNTWGLSYVRAACQDAGILLPPLPEQAQSFTHWQPQGAALFRHQEEAIQFLIANSGGLLGDQMGLGKTRGAIVTAETVSPQQPKLIVAPKFTRSSWQSELLATGAISSLDEMLCLEGRDVTKFEAWRRDARWYFLHFDIAEAWANRMFQVRPGVAIVDEAHYARTPKAKRTIGACASVLPVKCRIVMTGTPLANKPQDLWQLLVLAQGMYTWGSQLAFRQRYMGAVHTGYGWQDVEPTHVEELRQRLQSVYLARTLSSAGVTLPPRARVPVEVDLVHVEALDPSLDLDDAQRREIVRALMTGRVSNDVFTLLHKLRKHTAKGKVGATFDLANSLLQQDEPVVIFVHERASARAIATKLGHDAAYVITGEAEQAERDLTLSAWRQHCKRGAAALVATYGALGAGATLTEARYLILHDLDWVPATILQAEARIYRISQTRPSTIYWMVARNSIDALLARVLRRKAEYLDTILQDGGARDAFNETNLEEVIPNFEEDVASYVDAWTAGRS